MSTKLRQKARFTKNKASTVTLIQRFGCALNLNIRSHSLFLDDVYGRFGGGLGFRD